MEHDQQAYITVLSSENYLDGVKTLFYSLKKVKSKYPLIVLIPEEMDPKIRMKIEGWGLTVLTAPEIDLGSLKEKYSRQYWNNTFFKLRIFQLTQFTKLVYLDNDMIILKNLDHLFECNHITAVQGGKLIYHWEDINSGLMVICPNEKEFEDLVGLIPVVCQSEAKSKTGYGDQDIISCYYRTMNRLWPEEQHLDETYNAMIRCIHELCVYYGYQNLKVIHFIGEKKPWMFSLPAAIKYVIHYTLHHERYRAKCMLRYYACVVAARLKYR